MVTQRTTHDHRAMSEQDTSQDFPDHDPPPRDPGSGGGTQAPPQGPPRRLTRRTDDRVLAGVASGLGDYFNVDPAIFRLVFIVLTFFGGSGVMLYGLGWLFLPDRTTGKAVGEDLFRRALGGRSVARWLVIGLVAAVIIHAVMHEGGMLWAIVLVAVGVFAFRHNESSAATDTVDESPAGIPPPPPSSPPTQPLTQRPLSAPPPASVESSTIFDDWRPTPITAPPEPPPPPSVLGRITVAAALMLIGLVALIQNLSPLDVSVDHYAALALAVVGAGLLVGARLGRAHGLIVLGVVLAVVMALSAALPDVPIAGTPGQQTWTPATVADLRDHYELGAGELVLDLTDLELEPGQHVAVAASVGLGQLVVDVPPETTIDVDATSNLGEVVAFDLDSEGSNATIDHIKRGPEGSPTIALDLSVGAGQIEVTEASVSADPSERPTVPRRPE
jgi:phage shock protein PspC (stress-responsive transcriptional regulator)